MAYARFNGQQNTGGYARLPLQTKPAPVEPPKPSLVERAGQKLVPDSPTPYKDYGAAVLETAEKGTRKALTTGGRIFGTAVGAITGGALGAGTEALQDKPVVEKVKAVVQQAKQSGRETGQFASGVTQLPVDIVKETGKTAVAAGQALSGNEDAMVNRMAEVLARNANMGEAVLGRPFSTVEEAKALLLSGDEKGWAILKDPAVISAVGGMGLDLSVLSGAANKLVRTSGTRAGVPLQRPTGKVAEVMSTEFQARTGIKTPPGIVRATQMERSPLARATEPISKVMQKQAPTQFSLRPVEQLPPGKVPNQPTPTPTVGRLPAAPPPPPAKPGVLVAPEVGAKLRVDLIKLERQAPALSADDMEKTLNSIVDKYRDEAGMMASNQGAGVRSRNVTDARGNFQFQTNDFNLNRAKGDMARQAKDFRDAAYDDLYQNDELFRKLADNLETKRQAVVAPQKSALDDIDFGVDQPPAPRSAETPPVAKPTLYHGARGHVTEEPFAFQKVKEFATDQHDVIRDLAKQGNGKAQAIERNPVNFYQRADNVIREVFGNEFDAIKYANEQMPQKGVEYHDMKTGRFLSENRSTAEAYALQNREAKYDLPETSPSKSVEEVPTKVDSSGLDEFKNNFRKENKDYAMSHRPSETGAIASDISKAGEVIPEDVYTHPEWYGNMKEKTYQQSFAALKKIRGKPDAEITIYRASPKKELRNGDWVTLSKAYADDEGAREGTETHSFKVKAKDIQFAGDDINEFGYFPSDETLTDLYKKTNKKSGDSSTMLRVQIVPTFKQLDAMWQKAIGDRLWSGLVNIAKKGVQKAGAQPGKAGEFFRRMVAPKQFQTEDYIKMKDQLDVDIQKAIDRALSFGDELSKLSDEQQLEIVDRIVSGNYDNTPMGKLAEKVEAAFMELGQELVRQGKLSEEAFLKNYGRYFPRLYEKFERDGIQKIMGQLRGIKADLSYIKRRKDLPPEIREALGEIKKAPYPVAKRLLQEGIDVAKLKFFEKTAETSNLASSRPQKGWVQLPESKKLGALSGKYVPAEIEYDIKELSKAEPMSDFMKMIADANRVWKGTKTILDTGVITSNMASNVILADFAGLPPQRVDVWASAFFDVLKRKGSYLGMKDQGKFRNTFINQELQGFLPEIDKFNKVKVSDVKSMSDVTALMAHAVKKGWIKAGDAYNFLEEWSKTAVYKYHTESKGWTPKEAADHAETWLFNYGDVPPIIDKIRKFAFGPAFITFAYKSIPRFVESGVRMPFTWLKYIIAMNLLGGGAMMLKKLGMNEEEFKKVKPKTAGNWLIHAGRKKDGTHDFIDLSRYMPFGKFVNPRDPLSLSNIGRGMASSVMPSSGGWGAIKALDVIYSLVAGRAYRDKFFDKIIFNDTEKMDNDKRLFKALDYLWSDWTPGWTPSLSGDNAKPADYLRKAISGEQTRVKGIPQQYTIGEALMRFFGAKNVEMHPKLIREFEGGNVNQKISQLKAEISRSTSASEKQKLREEIAELQKEKGDLFKAVGKLQKAK